MAANKKAAPKSGAQKNIHHGQVGIADFPPFGHFATFFLGDDQKKNYALWLDVASITDRLCAKTKYRTVCIRGVDYGVWRQWCKMEGMPEPMGMTGHAHLEAKPFIHTGGDLWFHIKGESEKDCRKILDVIVAGLKPVAKGFTDTSAHKMHGGKVFGGRFIDGLINPVDPVNLSERVIVGDEDAAYQGSAYVIQQKFKHNWAELDNMNMVDKENMIGRNHHNAIIPMPDERSHIKCVRQLNGERITMRILRQALPYGASPTGEGKEEGVYFAAYAKDGEVFEELTKNITGPEEGFVKDGMLNHSHAINGNFWFVPAAKYLHLDGPKGDVHVPLNDYYKYRSKNGLMFYNNRDFLHQAQHADDKAEISDRILYLLGQTFSRWNDTWEKVVSMPSLGRLQDHLEAPRWEEVRTIGKSRSAALRKGLAIKVSLSETLLQQRFRDEALLYNIKPLEIIVGNMPPLTLGTGTQVMEYLHEDERIEAFFGTLNEYSATGHNIPDYHKVLRLGIGGMLDEANAKLAAATSDKHDFYQSVVWSLEGLRAFILAYAELALKLERETPQTATAERENYAAIAARMERLADHKPKGLLESLQLIFIVNCALHQIGEPMSIGRLDQYLAGAYEADVEKERLSPEQTQEIIDAFWLKMSETVLYNRQNMQDYLTYGTGAVFYSAGNFPQGSALNQWVQQVSVGGYLPTDAKTPEDGCNAVTLMCLRAARRLPLNAPCLSLRVHKRMKSALHKEIIAESARAIMSGGAHPVLMNDDKLAKGLFESGPLTLADARDYTSDGCYEPIIGGKSEWAFSYVPLLPVVGMAMNQGATIAGAGWIHLRGMKTGWNSPPPSEITSFEQFMDIFYTQYRWLIAQFYNSLMNSYGVLAGVCPSPLFSAMTDGCMESGRDMTDGGARYHIVAPMMCGITNAIDSLYAIRKMVFDEKSAVTTLPELLEALWNNWGETMIEPFQNVMAGKGRAENRALRYKELRRFSLALPKFGEGKCEELKRFADEVVGRCVRIIRDGIDKPLPSIGKAYASLKEKYRIDGRDFAFTVTPGVGTFEDNIGLGVGMGASADGRLSGAPVADDFSAAPSPSDLPPETEAHDIYASLADWNTPAIGIGLSNAAPVDLNVREDFPLKEMRKVVEQFAKGKIGSNLLTITAGDPETFDQARTFPERYDLVRVRQGGWSEFYMAMFPQHQAYISRRPYYGTGKAK